MEYGACVDVRDRRGMTPLLYAAKLAHADTAFFLIGKGANINAKAKDGRTVLHQVMTTPFKNFIERIAVKLLEMGFDTNAVDGEGRTVLHEAIRTRDVRLTRLLVSKGADVQLTDRRGNTPLYMAATHFEPENIATLVEAGAILGSGEVT